jgi:hypothetical protein
MRNPDHAQQLVEKLLWLVHTIGLWTQAINSGKWTSRGPKKDHCWCAIMVYAQATKWIKMKMKAYVRLNNNGNEIITWCSFNIGSCLLLNNHHHCMCYHRWYSLHHICASRINDDNVHQSTKVVSNNKNIHWLIMAKEKVKIPFEHVFCFPTQ